MNLTNLYSQKEKECKELLIEFSSIFSTLNFIKSLYKVYQFSDEPKFYQYHADLNDFSSKTDGWSTTSKRAGGASLFSDDLALLKCLGESVERYACSIYRTTSLIKGTFNEVRGQALNPYMTTFFSEKQKRSLRYSKFKFTDNTPFTWLWSFNLMKKKKVLVPAQLIYHSYKFHTGEGMLQVPISTGAAGGGCVASAILRGIYEVIERDAFMISYLNRLPRQKVDLTTINDETIETILDLIKRYRLEAHILDISTDLNISSFATLLIDRSGIGPSVQVGLKSSLNPIEAIVGSFQESLHALCWMRAEYEDKYKNYLNIAPQEIQKIEERSMYWYPVSKLKKLDFWLNQKALPLKQSSSDLKNMESGRELKKLLNILEKNNLEAFVVDVTPKELEHIHYKICKVIIPGMQQLYLDEHYRYLGGERLSNVPQRLGYYPSKEINLIPHPFL